MYCGVGGFLKKNTPDEVATQTAIYTRKGCERCIRWAFEYTRKRNNPKKMLTLVAKTNVLTYGHDLWWRTFQDVAKEYPDIKPDYNHVDACCMWMVKNPEYYDVIVTTNMFGDIITDLGGILQGGMGVAAGGNINPDPGGTSMFEPMGGSAPKYTGQNVINPIAAISAMAHAAGTHRPAESRPARLRSHQGRDRHEDEEPGRRQDGLQHAAGRRPGRRGPGLNSVGRRQTIFRTEPRTKKHGLNTDKRPKAAITPFFSGRRRNLLWLDPCCIGVSSVASFPWIR